MAQVVTRSQVNRRSLLNEVKDLALLLTRSFAALKIKHIFLFFDLVV